MAEFIAVAAGNGPRIKDPEAVRQVLDWYYIDPALGIRIDHRPETKAPRLFLDGRTWPEAWKIPPGVQAAQFNPHDDAYYDQGPNGWVQLLTQLAPFLEEPLTVHAVALVPGRFPIAACEWHIDLTSATIEINEFQYADVEP